ncbi:MAG TPA: hypothetical protein VLC46_16145 [Thermoanaerobaculia bacterium]|jgi:hypothetical protein|nr:hypothetical protein [Thermoanaerobaculia bacterium]
MLGRAAVAISILFLSVSAYPQCNLTQVASIPFRASYLDIAIDGNDLWAATSYGVSLYNRSVDPPVLVASLPLPGITRVVRVTNGLAYAGSGTTLFVVRENGSSLQLVRGIDAGATINDLLLTTLDLYVASANGLTQWDLLDPTTPSKTPATFVTSRSNVLSLALSGSTLFAADGDNSIETFNISIPSIPNGLGTISSLPSATAVNATFGRLYVSDGQQTDIFSNIDGGGTTAVKTATDSFGAVTVVPLTSTAIFAADAARQVRAFDLSSAAIPIELSRVQLQPSGGNVNRIGRLASAPNRLYVAGGDLGLLTYDTTSFMTPFPVRSYPTGATTSVVSLGTTVYVSNASSGITEFTQASDGALTQRRSWDSSNDIVRDGGNGFLFTTSGAIGSLWVLNSATPTLISSVTLRAPIASAALIGTVGYFVLTESSGNTLWSADLAPITPVAQQILLTGTKPSFVTRSGSSLALAELRGDGTTALSYYASADFTKAPATASVNGLSTGGVALSGTTAAVSTFSGLSIVDFTSGTTAILPHSTGAIALSLAFGGTTLAEATDTSLIVWNTQTRTMTKQYVLPAVPVAVHIGPDNAVADLATESGITGAQLGAATGLPSLLYATNGNGYYKKLVAGSQRLYFFDGRNVDIFTNTMQSTSGIRTPLIIDVAASDIGVFTIQNNLTVISYGRDGNTLSTSTINESSDAQAQSIVSAGGAAWASVIVNCQSSGCEGKTIVFDPKSAFAQTSTMTGAVRDLVTSGTRAYVLTELPNEVRVVDISDPAHPAIIVNRASEGVSQSPRAIAFSNGTVYVLGEKLYSYSPADLSKTGEQLASYVTDPTSGVTYVDQHLGADGACVALTGRQFSPMFLTGTPPVASPAAGRFIATQPGTFYFLTDYSLEIWSTKPLPPSARKRAAR